MSTNTVHHLEPAQLRGPLRAFGLPVDDMDDDAISSAALQLYGVGERYADSFSQFLPQSERDEAQSGPQLRKLADLCEAIEGLAETEDEAGETFRIEISAPHQPALIEEDFPADGIEQAAQLFAGRANPSPSAVGLVDLVEKLAQDGELRHTKPDGRTVVARLVTTGVAV